MNFSLTQFLILGLATFLFVGGLTPVMRKIALKIGAVDSPNLERKTQKEPVEGRSLRADEPSLFLTNGDCFPAMIKSLDCCEKTTSTLPSP